MKIAFAMLCCLGMVTSSMAQEEPEKTKDQYIGLQINQLVRQIFNFSSSGPGINNPYLITFASNSASGGGINIGFGYGHVLSDDRVDNLDRETKDNSFAFRIGYERKYTIGQRWVASWGIDGVIERVNTSTLARTSINDFSIETSDRQNGGGFGPRLTISYSIGDNMLIGTEANYYAVFGNTSSAIITTFTTTEFDPVTGTPRTVRQTQRDEMDGKFRRFQFNSPAVIFLIMKL